MQVMWRDRYGTVNRLASKDVATPVPGPDDLLVKVHAASLNRSDWEYLTGSPFYSRIEAPLKPKLKVLGTDLAGEVVQVGANVPNFQVGDRIMADVMYHGQGGFAEYALVRKGAPVARIPDGVTYSQAAALPQAGTIALQGLESVGEQDDVLVIGGGGATGIFAIQLAKARGAIVTAVDSGAKLEFMRELGADHVIDYRQADYEALHGSYSLILDPIAGLPLGLARRLLKPGGTYLIVGGSTRALLKTVVAGLRNRAVGRNLRVLMVRPSSGHLDELAQLVAKGDLRVPIEEEFSLADLPRALQRLGDGMATGRLIIRPPGQLPT